MIVAYGSDIHLEFGDLNPMPINRGADVLILAGDIFCLSKYHKWADYQKFIYAVCDSFPHVVYIEGNHENYFATRKSANEVLTAILELPDNFLYLQDSSVVIDGLTISGSVLWTSQFNKYSKAIARARDFSDFIYIENFSVEDSIEEHEKSVKFLESANADIIVTHHAPSGGSVNPKWAGHPDNGSFYTSLDGLILDIKPKLWIHGHMHDPANYNIGSTRVLCNPRGYPNEKSPRFVYDFKYVEVNK